MDTTSLRGHPLLGRIDPPLWAWTLEASDLLTVARGGVVYGPGRFRRCLGVVLRGRIEVRRESILMAALSAGDVFGAAALFNDSPDYPTTLTALSPCQTLLIPETRIRALLRQCPAFAEDYAAYLSGRIQFLSQRLEAVSSPSPEGKLARYLLANGGSSCPATELCQRLGVSRASLYRAFSALEDSGLITRKGKTITVIDPVGLETVL